VHDDDDDEIPVVRAVASFSISFFPFLRFTISFGRGISMGFLFSSLATFSAPLNWPEVSAIEIFMDFTREIETYPFP